MADGSKHHQNDQHCGRVRHPFQNRIAVCKVKEENNLVIAFAFIVLDFVTGLIKAVATHSFTSTKMRQGLFHKVALLLCMILGCLADHAQGYMDLGISVPVAAAVCVYICLMEITSIIENVCKINPQIVPEKLVSLFGGLKKEDNHTGDKEE